ncbi:MAG: anthranilate phosphoribosyltransferase [Elusimicrobia bacterium]|nr:anthranilate phosphoribosyltransferase [Elusimicrobiota bacterium]
MIKEAIGKIVEKKDLSEQEAIEVMNEIMNGEATEAQIGAFITALRMKGETVEEITGCAKVMREQATPIRVANNKVVDLDRDDINIEPETIVDTCGTGGDRTNTFNISTASAFVVAGAGLKVAKHGNRSVSSLCGSADVIETLGINLNVPPTEVEKCLNEVGISFLFAPLLHGAMKYAAGPRKQIGIRTIFNILGPLSNPAKATAQVLGVYSEHLCEVMARVLGNLGVRRAMVVHGLDAIDEISITGPTQVAELKDDQVKSYDVFPEQFGLKSATMEDIRGGNAQKNAQIILNILKGEKGVKRDIVLLNAAAAIYVGGKVKNMERGIKIASDSIDSGKALEKLESLREYTNKINDK